MKIKQIKLNTIIWPAVMFANKRTINANGFDNTPIISTGIIIGYNHHGTSGKKMCFQYDLFPLMLVTKNVITPITTVKAILPVKLAPPGKNGTKPIMLLIQMKKNIVNKKGMNLAYLYPKFGLAISSLTKMMIGSIKDWKPFGAFPSLFLYDDATEVKINNNNIK